MKAWLKNQFTIWSLWSRALSAWFKEARHVWFAIVVSLVALLWVFYNPTDFSTRCTSMALQLLGIGTIVFDFLKAFIKSFSRLPIPGRQHRTLTASLPAPKPTAFGVGRVTPPKASLEDRIVGLETSVDDVRSQIESLKHRLDAELKQEAINRTAADQQVIERLVRSESRNLSLAAGGSLLIAVGVVLSSFLAEIAT